MHNSTFTSTAPHFHWDEIDTVMLDMDGTLLDKHYDDYFWEHYLPSIYAEKNNIDGNFAKTTLIEKYKSVESSLQWTDIHYWTRQLNLDILQLKRDLSHLIAVLPGVIDFLSFIRNTGKNIHLVTNAHPLALAIKLEKTGISSYFDSIVTSDGVGHAKEQAGFWKKLGQHIDFEKSRTLFIDDTERVLHAANQYGIAFLVHIAYANSHLPPRFSERFFSISNFTALLEKRSVPEYKPGCDPIQKY